MDRISFDEATASVTDESFAEYARWTDQFTDEQYKKIYFCKIGDSVEARFGVGQHLKKFAFVNRTDVLVNGSQGSQGSQAIQDDPPSIQDDPPSIPVDPDTIHGDPGALTTSRGDILAARKALSDTHRVSEPRAGEWKGERYIGFFVYLQAKNTGLRVEVVEWERRGFKLRLVEGDPQTPGFDVIDWTSNDEVVSLRESVDELVNGGNTIIAGRGETPKRHLPQGLKDTGYRVVKWLQLDPVLGERGVVEIAEGTGISVPAVRGALAGLQKRGLVESITAMGPKGGAASVYVKLTEEGRNVE